MGVGMASQFVGRWHAISLMLTCTEYSAYLFGVYIIYNMLHCMSHMRCSVRCLNAILLYVLHAYLYAFIVCHT